MEHGFSILGVAALGIVVMVVAGVAFLWALYALIRHLLWRATHQVLNRAVDRVVDVGERHLVSGVGTLTKTVGEEIRKNDPRRLEADVSRLAQERKGRISVADVMAKLDLAQDVASRTLEGLAKRGVCRPTPEEGGSLVYLFDSFLPRRQVVACDYCGGSFGDADPSQPCPSCGASLTRKSVVG